MDRRILAKLLVLIGILSLLAGLSGVVSAAPPEVPQAAPSPRPPAFGGQQEEGGKKRSEPDIHSDLWGTVTDLSTGRPGQGTVVVINGMVVRTDSSGRFSLTGLPAGEYILWLELPGGATPARPQWTVQLDGQTAAAVELEYFSQSVTETPASTVTPTPAVVLPQTGAAGRQALWLIVGLVFCGAGLLIILWARKGKTIL